MDIQHEEFGSKGTFFVQEGVTGLLSLRTQKQDRPGSSLSIPKYLRP